jgi:acetyl-CoA synthetase (ADP-forming)
MVTMDESLFEAARGRGWLLEPEAKELCRKYGLPVAEWKVATTANEARDAADSIGYPVVMKIVSQDVLHKSDVGGVLLNITDAAGAEDAFRKIEGIRDRIGCRLEGALVERMAPPGTETIIGAKLDPQFGPVVLFGLGGIFVEIFKDVSFRVAPIGKGDALDMMSELKAYPLLKGARGRAPADTEALADALLKVSGMMMQEPMIQELDLNPTIAYEKGCRVVDARVILRKG